jgi:ribosomal protein L16 Arg81 hydroxylase
VTVTARRSALTRLLAPASAEAFRTALWPDHHVVVHGDVERFAAIARFAAAPALDEALAACRDVVMVVGEAAVEASEGIADRFLVSPERARAWYAAGATLELDCADHYLPELRPFLDELRGDLGLPEGSFSKAIIYASPRSSGFQPHFDAYANFVLHLRGRKVWRLAPNHQARDPMEHYDLAEAPYIPPELASYWQGPPVAAIPEGGVEVELRPGSLLFVPRGTWHCTEAQEDETISLNLTFSQPTWLDLLLSEIRGRLVRHRHWRELADGVGAREEARRTAARDRLESLVARLFDDLGACAADQLLARQAEPHEPYQVAGAIFRQLLRLR